MTLAALAAAWLLAAAVAAALIGYGIHRADAEAALREPFDLDA